MHLQPSKIWELFTLRAKGTLMDITLFLIEGGELPGMSSLPEAHHSSSLISTATTAVDSKIDSLEASVDAKKKNR